MRDAFRLLGWATLLLLAAAPRQTCVAADPHSSMARFTGEQSCRTSGCHGGGEGKNQCIIWEKKDVHAKGNAILSNARSKRIVETMGTADANKDGRCTVCHSPFQSVPESRFVEGVKAETGVSCETCHGAAEGWLRFHTRKDITHEQRLAAGLRELNDFYNRSNTCVACHVYVDPAIVKAGHPELNFDLAQQKNQPPHWKDPKDDWAAPRAWATSQAASLRELSWRATSNPDEDLQARSRGLLWLLRQTASGKGQLAETANDMPSIQTAADRFARSASKASWSKESTLAQLRLFAGTSDSFREEATPVPEHRRRAEVLITSVDRFWETLKTSAGLASPTLETALGIAKGEAKTQANFQPARFAAALQQVEVALVQLNTTSAATSPDAKKKE